MSLSKNKLIALSGFVLGAGLITLSVMIPSYASHDEEYATRGELRYLLVDGITTDDLGSGRGKIVVQKGKRAQQFDINTGVIATNHGTVAKCASYCSSTNCGTHKHFDWVEASAGEMLPFPRSDQAGSTHAVSWHLVKNFKFKEAGNEAIKIERDSWVSAVDGIPPANGKRFMTTALFKGDATYDSGTCYQTVTTELIDTNGSSSVTDTYTFARISAQME